MEKKINQRIYNFEHLLWKNELEYNRRELAIFESFLLNLDIQRKIHPDQLARIMAQLYQYSQLVDKMLAEITQGAEEESSPPHSTDQKPKLEACKYLREEIFYFEQDYRRFRHTFCSLAEGLEAA